MALFDLTGFQRDLLVIIATLDRPSGQEIKAQFEEDADISITHGRLYPNLDTLIEAGYVEKGELDRRTNYYALTEQGEAALRERTSWRQQHLDDHLLPA